MSHTLHRRGSKESLMEDFPMLAMGAQNVNRDGCAPKLAKVLEIMMKHNPVSYGSPPNNKFNSDADTIFKNIKDTSVMHAVYKTEDDVIAALKELREADLGISIVVSGLFEQAHQCCKQAGLKPHTVNTSLGIYGCTEKLPDEQILEIHTMCGHGMVPYNLIYDMIDRIKAGKMTCRQAAEKMGSGCICGIFNVDRAEKLLEKFL